MTVIVAESFSMNAEPDNHNLAEIELNRCKGPAPAAAEEVHQELLQNTEVESTMGMKERV